MPDMVPFRQSGKALARGFAEGVAIANRIDEQMSEEPMTFAREYLAETIAILSAQSATSIERCVRMLVALRDGGGRLFVLGNGGSAANAQHAVNDFRKMCGIEAYAPTDNVAELTARTNDDGWQSTFLDWLMVSRLDARDMLLVLSVGGGSDDTSQNIQAAVRYADGIGARVIGMLGSPMGEAARIAAVSLVAAPVAPERITPHAEELQAVLWHLMVSHPDLMRRA